jgi:hypothetical protein
MRCQCEIRNSMPSNLCRLLLLTVLVLPLCQPRISQAATGGVINLPFPKARKPGPPPKPDPRAMNLSIDSTWVECTGYRPVRITITPTPPLTVDRTVTVVFRPAHWSHQALAAVSQDIEVPSGATSVTATLSVPQWEPWTTFTLDTYDDGMPVEDLSLPRYSFNLAAPNSLWGDGASPNILFLGTTKDPSALFAAFSRTNESAIQMKLGPSVYSGGTMAPPMTPGVNPKFASVPGIMSHAELPTRWLDYSGLDVIYATLPELKELIEKHPEQWQAMRTWLAAGGNLWVADCGMRWQRLPELLELVDLPEFTKTAPGEGPLAGWTKPDPAARHEAIIGASRQYGGIVTTATGMLPAGATMAADGSITMNRPNQPNRPSMQIPFVMRNVGLGQVVALAERDPLDAQNGIAWPWVFNSVTPDRWQWYLRHGLSLQRDNLDFWDFLIPGVGLAPVTQFQILITLFVVVIGPVNFLVLRRWHKLNLLVITVPASALSITLCLFLYALLADGLGVRVRARSFTALDQTRSEAVCWGRLSYYAGLAPSQGLAFPRDTAVFPLDDKPGGNNYNSARRMRETDWRDQQFLGRGWLAARTPTQMMTVAAHKSSHRLVVRETAAAPPSVENQLGTRIVQLLLVDSEGNHFEGSSLADRGKASLSATSPSKIAPRLSKQLSTHAPELPIGFSRQRYGLFGMRSQNYYYNNYGTDLAEPTLRQSILERELARHCSLKVADLPPRTYVAILDTSPELSLGLESAREEAGFHVLVGKW